MKKNKVLWQVVQQVCRNPLWMAGILLCAVYLRPAPLLSGPTPTGTGRTYSTNFPAPPAPEDPISEGGNWANGLADGLDWSNVATQGGLAFIGTQSPAASFNDSTAIVKGAWRPDQMVQATVHSINQSGSVTQEVELRLRTTITPHSITGYEITWRALKGNPASYQGMARWNGALGDFTSLSLHAGAANGVKDGDVVKATIVGNVITAYLDGVQVDQVVDSTFKTGSPGIGFGFDGAFPPTDYGFTSFTAAELTSTGPQSKKVIIF